MLPDPVEVPSEVINEQVGLDRLSFPRPSGRLVVVGPGVDADLPVIDTEDAASRSVADREVEAGHPLAIAQGELDRAPDSSPSFYPLLQGENGGASTTSTHVRVVLG